MWRTIEKIRNKPVASRQRLALGVTVMVTALIFGVWLSIWYGRLTTAEESSAKAAIVEKSDSPIATVKNTFGQVFGQIIEQVGLIKGLVNTNLAAVEEYSQATSTAFEAKATTETEQLSATSTATSTASTTSVQ